MSQDYVEQVTWFILKTIAKRIRRLFKKNDQKKTSSENVLALEDNKEESIPSCSKTALEETAEENTEATSVNVSKEPKDENVHSSVISAESVEGNADEATIDESEIRVTDVTETVEAPQPQETQPFQNLSETNNAIFFHSSIFFIWAFVTILNAPAVLTWAHNFR